MSANVAPSIVRTGLVLDLDAANNKSYVSGSTEWRDLTPSFITGSLTNGPTFNGNNGGSIQFDGINDGSTFGNVLNFGSGSFSLDCWFNRTGDSTDEYGAVLVGKGAYGTPYQGYSLYVNDSTYIGGKIGFQTRRLDDTNYAVESLSSPVNGIWYNAIATRNVQTKTITMYVNGVFNNVTNETTTLDTVSNYDFRVASLEIQSPFPSPRNFYGRIASVKVYNRALSAQEVLQNYNALKGRFGL